MTADNTPLTIGDVVSLQRGTTYKSALLDMPGPVLLGLASIARNGGFRPNNLATYGGESPEKLILGPGDLYVSLKDVTQSADLLGSVARVPPTVRAGRLTQDTVKLTFKRGDIPPSFLYWLLRTPDYRDYCRSRAIGTTNLALAREDFLAFPIPRPTPPVMGLVTLLDALDDKIDLNRRMNATLEGMAQALFQSWFVDFDPARAKVDGRQPAGMDAATAALFPSAFRESAIGPIPSSWVTSALPQVVAVNPPRSLRRGTVAPSVDMKALPTAGHCMESTLDRVFASGSRFQNGDTLLARITPCLENGKTAFVDILEDGQVGWGSTEFIVLSPKPPLPPQFGYLLARSDALRSHAIQNMTGTSGRQRVPTGCFDSFLVAVPPAAVAERFGAITASLMNGIQANARQSRTLAALRDTLLPKLLSGELRVPEALRTAEAVL